MSRIIYITVACIFLTCSLAFGQQEALSIDEHNKYVYYKEVNIAGVTADSLKTRALLYVKSVYPKGKVSQVTKGSILAEGKFLTMSGISVLKHEDGQIAYTLHVEFKDARYRYWFSDFVFTPYQRDRYGNFVLATGIDIPLEKASAKLDKKEAGSYLDQTAAFCKLSGELLKIKMINATPALNAPPPGRIKISKW